MKINWLVRIKNPNFWIGLVAVILMAMGVDASMFTTWSSVLDAIKGLFSNPFMLAAVVVALWGYVQDFTTKGTGDTALALSYTEPKDAADSENDYEIIRAIKEDGYAAVTEVGDDNE
ncbi:MAG: phage holin [Bacillota bacterium]|nr:phage holin [Bacillota bacterium]